jgi:hypothetical protein
VVVTTLKPRIIIELAKLNACGNAMRPFFEGGLPWIYLVPRKEGSQAFVSAEVHDDETAILDNVK